MKVKVGLIGLFDMLKFKNLAKNRKELIDSTSAKALPYSYVVNDLAKLYHPYKQKLIIEQIVEEGKDVKSFILTSNEKLAPFKAGSYISIYVQINNEIASRAYSLSSSPLDVAKGFYRITIKRAPHGLVSNYMLDHAKVGDELYASEPGGFLIYNRLRDAKNVIAVAGGVGITPFISMAKAINDHVEDFNLTILYGVNKKEDIIFKDEIDYLNKTDKVKIVYVFAKEEVPGYPHGFITSDLIKQYAKDEYSVFATGPRGLLDSLVNELPKLNLPKKYIRLEQSPLCLKSEPVEYKIRVHVNGEVVDIKAKSTETILQALEHSNISIRSKCHLGGCGFCRSKLISGCYEATKFENIKEIDRKFNYIHPCCSYPRSNMEIEVYEY